MSDTTLDSTLNSIKRPPSLKSFQNRLFSKSPLIPEQPRQPTKYKHIIYIIFTRVTCLQCVPRFMQDRTFLPSVYNQQTPQ